MCHRILSQSPAIFQTTKASTDFMIDYVNPYYVENMTSMENAANEEGSRNRSSERNRVRRLVC